MAVVAYGYDREAGGMVGEYTHAGVADETWQTWDSHTQDLWLQDYYRTEAQANYYKDSPQAVAFEYVSTIDSATQKTTDFAGDALDTTLDIGQNAVILGALALGILLVK